MVTRWCESIPKFELVINPQTVSQKFSKESTNITKDYWVGVQQAKSTTKIRMHNLSVYFDYWKGRTKNNYSKFFMFMARQISVMLIFTSDHERCDTSYFQAEYNLCGLSCKIAVPREDSDVSSNIASILMYLMMKHYGCGARNDDVYNQFISVEKLMYAEGEKNLIHRCSGFESESECLESEKDEINLCIDHDLVYTNKEIHQYQKEGVYLIQSYFEHGYNILHEHSASYFTPSDLRQERHDLKLKTKGMIVKIPVDHTYEDINPGNVGEVYFEAHHGMMITGVCQYSLESFQYLLAEHRAWPSEFLNLCPGICALKQKKKVTISLLSHV